MPPCLDLLYWSSLVILWFSSTLFGALCVNHKMRLQRIKIPICGSDAALHLQWWFYWVSPGYLEPSPLGMLKLSSSTSFASSMHFKGCIFLCSTAQDSPRYASSGSQCVEVKKKKEFLQNLLHLRILLDISNNIMPAVVKLNDAEERIKAPVILMILWWTAKMNIP